MPNNQKIFICIPTYNEAENIEKLIKSIFALNIDNLYLIIVDDNSTDKTGEIVDKMAQKLPIKVIHRPAKMGIGSAYITAFKYALQNNGKYIFEMDADFSHNPKDIPRLLKEAKKGYQVVLGSRKIKGGKIENWNIWRYIASDGAMFFASFFLGLKTKDVTTGFRCYDREVLKKIDLHKIKSNGYAFQEEMIYLCEKKGFKIKEIPIVFVDRRYGKSKLSIKDIIEFFIKIIRLKFKK